MKSIHNFYCVGGVMIALSSMEKILVKYGIFTRSETVKITIEGNKDFIPEHYSVHTMNGSSHEMKIDGSENDYIKIYKKNGIKIEEKEFTQNFIIKVNKILSTEIEGNYLETLCERIQTESILEAIINGNQTLKFAILKSIDILDCWSKETYEAQSICAAIGFDPELIDQSGMDIDTLMHDDMMKVMSNGIDTMFLCNSVGKVVTVKNFNENFHSTPPANTPLAFFKIAQWTKNRKIAIVLTQRGEILIFTAEGLSFARRRGRWSFINLKQASHVVGEDTSGSLTVVRNAVLDTCLDVSFRRTGACIGIVRTATRWDECVQDDDILSSSEKPRAVFLRNLIGNTKFQNLNRSVRQELAAIDGALVLSGDGTILAAGAILNIAGGGAGRTTGGRSVAAQTLAKYGYGIKVSADGQIQSWKDSSQTDGPVTPHFTIG